jgi:hypothetical protein
MCAATSGAQYVVMEHLDITQIVHDHQATLQAEAQEHRKSKTADTPTARQPRLRYQRRNRTAVVARQTLACD